MGIDNRYWAGLFDGEGNINVAKDLVHVQVALTQKEPKILHLLEDAFGGGVTKYGKQTCYKWRVWKIEDMIVFLESILPFSIIKKTEISISLEFLYGMRKENLGYNPLSLEERMRRMKLRERLLEDRHSVS